MIRRLLYQSIHLKAAKGKAHCIVFFDELDAIGKSRAQGAVGAGGFDERENTLNQFPVEAAHERMSTGPSTSSSRLHLSCRLVT